MTIAMSEMPLPVNFTLSDFAKAEIMRLKAIWPQLTQEEPGYLLIGWGEVYYNDGRQSGMVVVSFYPASDDEELRPFVQQVSGIDFIFFTTLTHWWRFLDKVLDHTSENSFFLR